MRIAVVGHIGRLGTALLRAIAASPATAGATLILWDQPEFQLDTVTAASFGALLDAERPDVVVMTAAWTDVDGCAKDPAAAMRRNGTAVGEVALATAARGVDLVAISTNEVFDGARTDGQGYRPDDTRRPINAYGAAKALAEQLAITAYASPGASGRLGIVRTSWLYGPPGNDFPEKIARAALRAKAAGEPLRAVADEIGVPTYTPDLAAGIVELVGASAIAAPGTSWQIHHLVNGGRASRADWAREVLRATNIVVDVVDVPMSTWQRASTPPPWAVLEPTPLPSGRPLRPWQEAFADALPALLGNLAAG